MAKKIFICLLTFCFYNHSSGQAHTFPYKLNKTDYAIIPIAVTTECCAIFLENKQPKMTENELSMLNKNDINLFDRNATDKWNLQIDQISDYTTYALLISPSVMMLNDLQNKNWNHILTYGMIYFETSLLTMGIKDLTKSVVKRKRPYLYNTEISTEEKEMLIDQNKAYDSFFSGHTAGAFSTAVFISKTYSDIFGKTKLSRVIWFGSISTACVIGYLRYAAGQHYPSDIISGAIVGTAIGYFIPELHKINRIQNQISWVISPGNVYVKYKF